MEGLTMRINSFVQSDGKKALDLRDLSAFEFDFLAQTLANMVAAKMCSDEPEAQAFLELDLHPSDFG
jgi:hypothetical protein